VPVLAPAYLPRRPTETVLYGLVREHLESFLAHAREHYDDGLPPYVESELRAYLKCGVFSEGFSRAHCDSCGHDLLVAFSCHGRSICPSCCGRRMANTAAHLVDRILPDVPVRQYVLTLPYDLRKLAAFKADVLTALARIFVESVFAAYCGRAKRAGIPAPQCGAVTFVQRFGSLNLHVHFHAVVLDGVFARDAQGRIAFHPAQPPEARDLEAIVDRTARASMAWLRRRGYLDRTETPRTAPVGPCSPSSATASTCTQGSALPKAMISDANDCAATARGLRCLSSACGGCPAAALDIA
jgi:hypothetical protein